MYKNMPSDDEIKALANDFGDLDGGNGGGGWSPNGGGNGGRGFNPPQPPQTYKKYYFYNAQNQLCNDSSAVQYAIVKYDGNGNTLDQQWFDVPGNMTVGRTPSGGAYVLTNYYDEYNRPCNRQSAVSFVDQEFDDSGNLINESRGSLQKSRVDIDNDDTKKKKTIDTRKKVTPPRSSSIKYLVSLLLFYLKGEISFEQNFIRFKTPNTILGFIPLGSKKESMPINQLSVVSTDFHLDFKGFLVGLVIAVVTAILAFEDFPEDAFALIGTLFGIIMCISSFETILTVEATSGKVISVPFWIIEKKKAEEAEERINNLISGRLDDTNNRQQTDRIVDAIYHNR